MCYTHNTKHQCFVVPEKYCIWIMYNTSDNLYHCVNRFSHPKKLSISAIEKVLYNTFGQYDGFSCISPQYDGITFEILKERVVYDRGVTMGFTHESLGEGIQLVIDDNNSVVIEDWDRCQHEFDIDSCETLDGGTIGN